MLPCPSSSACPIVSYAAVHEIAFADASIAVGAVIKEGLRCGMSVPGMLPRVAPPEGTTIDGVQVPGGTVVQSSAVFVHRDGTLFQEPLEFKPERWLQPDSHELDKFLVPFSKGTRSCIGRPLAMAELYFFVAYFNVYHKMEHLPAPSGRSYLSYDHFTSAPIERLRGRLL